MRRYLVSFLGLFLFLGGLFNFYWWYLPLKDMKELGWVSPKPHTWQELDQSFPHFARACRAVGENPFQKGTVPEHQKEAMRLSQKIYKRCGLQAMLGVVLIIFGIALVIMARYIGKEVNTKKSTTPTS